MTYSLVIRAEAELDIQQAYQYYEAREPGLGSEFVRAIDACLSKIRRNPMAYPKAYQQIRRALIRRFPYSIFYVVEEKRVVVIACFHAERDPQSLGNREP